ncbi:MAG: TolC family protein [Candidatus Binataceae bacterium]
MRRFYRFAVAIFVPVMMLLAARRALCASAISLNQAIVRALQLAPSLELAAAQSNLSGAQVGEARAPLFPVIAGAAEYNDSPGYDPTISNNGLSLAQLSLGYIAFDGGRRLALLRAARYARQAATLGVRAAKAQIVHDVTVAYFDLMRARETEDEQRVSLARLRRYVSIIESLRNTGRANDSDVLKIKSARDSAELALAAARETREHASIVLGSMIGEYESPDLVVLEVSQLPSLPKGNIDASPAIRAAERQIQSEQARIRAAQDERYPTFTLALTAGYEGVYPRQTLRRFYGASYDGAMSIPIFAGGLISSHVDIARANQQAADARLRAIHLQVMRDFADARVHYLSARRQLAIIKNSQADVNDAFALDWMRFLGGGNVTLLEVLTSYQQTISLRLARLAQEFAMRQAVAQAQLMLGLAP